MFYYIMFIIDFLLIKLYQIKKKLLKFILLRNHRFFKIIKYINYQIYLFYIFNKSFTEYLFLLSKIGKSSSHYI